VCSNTNTFANFLNRISSHFISSPESESCYSCRKLKEKHTHPSQNKENAKGKALNAAQVPFASFRFALVAIKYVQTLAVKSNGLI